MPRVCRLGILVFVTIAACSKEAPRPAVPEATPLTVTPAAPSVAGDAPAAAGTPWDMRVHFRLVPTAKDPYPKGIVSLVIERRGKPGEQIVSLGEHDCDSLLQSAPGCSADHQPNELARAACWLAGGGFEWIVIRRGQDLVVREHGVDEVDDNDSQAGVECSGPLRDAKEVRLDAKVNTIVVGDLETK